MGDSDLISERCPLETGARSETERELRRLRLHGMLGRPTKLFPWDAFGGDDCGMANGDKMTMVALYV